MSFILSYAVENKPGRMIDVHQNNDLRSIICDVSTIIHA